MFGKRGALLGRDRGGIDARIRGGVGGDVVPAGRRDPHDEVGDPLEGLDVDDDHDAAGLSEVLEHLFVDRGIESAEGGIDYVEPGILEGVDGDDQTLIRTHDELTDLLDGEAAPHRLVEFLKSLVLEPERGMGHPRSRYRVEDPRYVATSRWKYSTSTATRGRLRDVPVTFIEGLATPRTSKSPFQR